MTDIDKLREENVQLKKELKMKNEDISSLSSRNK